MKIGFENVKEYDVNYKAHLTYQRVKRLILNYNKNIVVSFSGGKDSSLVLYFVLKIIKNNKSKIQRINKSISVVYVNTGVEIPIYLDWVKNFITSLKAWLKKENLNDKISVEVIEPNYDHSFWYYLLIRGYPTPTYFFRWCTDKLKIAPMKKYVKSRKPAIVIMASRNGESAGRNVSLRKRVKRKYWGVFEGVKDVETYYPIIDWTTNEVLNYLSRENTLTPWGENYRNLISLYEKASGCRLARFGCWICTVIKKDDTLLNLYKSGYKPAKDLLEFKEYLHMITRDEKNRVHLKNGELSYVKFSVRKEILNELINFVEKFKYKYDIDILHPSELEFLKRKFNGGKKDGLRI